MSTTSPWRSLRNISGPFPARLTDIDPLNRVFSDAFTERYRRDGMVGVRVPYLNPAIWRYAIEDAHGGAMLWRDERDEIVAFNIAHHSGVEGWMGPLAVRPEWQGSGVGRAVVQAGIDWLLDRNVKVLGLETMPRTMDNIGFYSRLGFSPGRLTITVTLEAATHDVAVPLLGALPPRDRDDVVAQCRRLTQEQLPGYDFSRELLLTLELGLGDVVLRYERGALVGFALFHSAPLVEGRSREELRVLKLALSREGDITAMAALLAGAARQAGTRRVAIRVQGEYTDAYRELISLGARVRWTDLRMVVAGRAESRAATGMVLSNWEI
ncbi:MAG: GNAT family N-acetyltransferase [Gemmatimonadetes bacterium]|jgi:GNAT superfamily N-acetyltransferase|nr:GNAT family N-acetyltransferase [Gemmatimonadota bacterium]MCC7324832.1 GNAT family N-acetyltransferase [Gemmatimonadaceae bacterium]MBK7833194.1 GNAT family N-acetyltransferase [Gemmatimonadota bacterium]MBK8057672.1 GNAT family N-acetyltransferase [Gemmatimonadota bacterium]MBK8646614.1 GNAT family N-acetyltransferase [Gemmatimonadota bacterium]